MKKKAAAKKRAKKAAKQAKVVGKKHTRADLSDKQKVALKQVEDALPPGVRNPRMAKFDTLFYKRREKRWDDLTKIPGGARSIDDLPAGAANALKRKGRVQLILEERLLLHGYGGGQFKTVYMEWMPDLMIAFFQDAYEQVEEIERDVSKAGLKYVQKPVTPPTFEGCALELGVGVSTLRSWVQDENHPELAAAFEIAKHLQHEVITRMTALGGWSPAFGALMLKNCSGWSDKSEVDHNIRPVLKFDAQDEDA